MTKTPPMLAALAAASLMSACSMEIGTVSLRGDAATTTASVRAPAREAVLESDGSCAADAGGSSARPAAIAEGIGECDLVRLKGSAPTDVLIGESGKGQREVQVLYNEPTGREIYLFVDNKLTRIVRPGQG